MRRFLGTLAALALISLLTTCGQPRDNAATSASTAAAPVLATWDPSQPRVEPRAGLGVSQEQVPVPTVPADAPAVRGRTAWFRGARTIGDGRELLLTFTGSTVLDRTQPCWEGYETEVLETATTVTVTIHRLSVPADRGINFGCAAVGRNRTVAASLSRPLGERSLVDGAEFGGPRSVFDGRLVLKPRYLPDGWAQTSEEGGPPVAGLSGGEAVAGWLQAFGPPTRVVNDTCADEQPILWLGTSTPHGSDGTAAPIDVVLGRPVVRGFEGLLVHVHDKDMVRLTWNEGTTRYTLQTVKPCATTGPPDPALVVRVAQSLT